MHRFFINSDSINNDKIIITGDDVKHIGKVLRLKTGDIISAGDGRGFEYICRIDSINRDAVYCSIIEKARNVSEPPVRVDLYQGLPKSSKMDLIVQKCVELGINTITPVDTDRTVVDTEYSRGISSRITRWQRISEEAAKQCGRGKIPEIKNVVTFSEAIENLQGYDIMLIPYEKESKMGLKQILRDKNNASSFAIFIGPEGGFSEGEIEMARKKGIVPVTLGPRILRTETAGFTCLSIIIYELGDTGGELWKG